MSLKRNSEIEKEISKLETFEDKKQYLKQIFEDDQKVRGSEGQNLMLKYGKDSKEYNNYIKVQWEMDELNLAKIEKYLEIHDYPNKEYGDIVTTTPWLIIHHAQCYEVRERNFDKVYEAYLKGYIDDGAISFYLGRMYQIKNGEQFKMEKKYKF